MKTGYSEDPDKQTAKQTNTTTIIIRLSPSSKNNNDNYYIINYIRIVPYVKLFRGAV